MQSLPTPRHWASPLSRRRQGRIILLVSNHHLTFPLHPRQALVMGFSDILAFTFTLALVGGFVYGVVYVVNLVNQSVESTKANLKSKGMDISANGVSVKTDKYVDRQDYIDATQRMLTLRSPGKSSMLWRPHPLQRAVELQGLE
ncbi:hypothetical protein BKA70DRAFT_1231425 [Coprinopsis sp. MPI-PUGE-AT-0042]|nr:hypothetical protein BKA70DRAFT_1231425 [Coprinopsis sp. MPI-PUGE-AT-0042]